MGNKANNNNSKDTSFRPKNLRTLLVLLLFILVAGSSGVFYLKLTELKNYATDVNQALADAEAKEKQLSDLKVLESQLAQSNELVSKAEKMFSTEDTYQSQMLNDIRQYADASNLTIASTSFEEGSNTIVVNFISPVSYDSLLLFLNNVETNLPKLQTTSLSISRLTDVSNSDMVEVGAIKIEASVR